MKADARDAALLWLRVLAGGGMAYHGYGKVFGDHLSMLTQGVAGMGFPMPEVFAWAAALSEFAGGLLLAAGLFTRPAALSIFITMCVAGFVAHAKDPWQAKELAFAYWAIAATFVISGGGAYSLDAKFKK